MTSTIIPTKDLAALGHGTASAWINVHHEDGPTSAQVDEICGKYEGRSFDGMTDTYTDHGTILVAGEPGEMPTEVLYGCDGINTSRDFTAAGHLVAQRIIREFSNMPHPILCDENGELAEGRDITGGQGCEFNDGHHAWDRAQLSAWSAVRFLLQHTDLIPKPARQ
ncbi:LPD29 domain-containing protein [Curtobacterium flaccumfaciens]|uniref:LPD29 domain-containing protein n=1 Tax=Curtobacterium flaccumfaciens TaxID=2035 RepID=UPI001BDEE5D1|nr:LPD29 domain-containing protein [Curtobacterium flaccumfaciens]MBT1608629.1 hypothetical protein [Curtobacterium flaccumfaciens pv. betae]MBT1658502.1 hypothetical protein [Curtobacterium flaccumfaciens pv. betae]MCS0472882.1 hypothetical protein [Curtobacterium flaccumfaciens pv. betae]MCS0476301.1 hypothetical protein [Curtobacterium flaccumfaciens pv. betae]MCS0479731.1 hypothetical protein [Curtobacterium flaccumfaciens pv. betae]